MSDGTVCIVLAGGLGTRLRSVVQDLPKCLAPVDGRPFLEIQLETLAAQGVGRFILSLGYLAPLVEQAARAFRLADRIGVVVEPQALGTGGAVLHAMQSTGTAEALVANGDTHLEAPLAAMLEPLAAAQGEQLRMAVVPVPDRQRFGGVVLGEDGTVEGFAEKGRQGPGPINAGLYRVGRAAFEGFEPGSTFSMENDVFPRLVARRALKAAPLEGSFIDIGVPDDYFAFCRQHGG